MKSRIIDKSRRPVLFDRSRPYNNGIAKRQSASTYLKALADIGVLEEEEVGRDKVFIHRKYMTLLGADDHTFEPFPTPGPRPKRRS